MKEFKDKVAVITGAASGIGRAIAERCSQEGMKVVLADIEQQALDQAEQALKDASTSVLAVRTDVSRAEDVSLLARKTIDAFGAIDLLFNNAGVGAGSTPWESTLADWQWVLGVNLWGVIHGIQVFVPIMLDQDKECHIVNTSSVAGLLPYHHCTPYQVTKHAVLALSENLYYSLVQKKAKIKVSVLCPGWVNSRIMESERNRPPELQNEPDQHPPSPERDVIQREMVQAVETGMSPTQLASIVFSAIQEEKFYIISHLEYNHFIQQRMMDILQQRNPS